MTWPPQHTTYLGKTSGRPPHYRFGIKQADRLMHTYIVGKSGTGKSTLLEQMILQDIKSGRGCCLIDPHGDLVARIAATITEDRLSDLVYLNVPEVHQVYGYNPLRYVSPSKRSLAASGVLEVFKKIWGDSWGVRMEHILRNAILTLLEIRGSDLSDILRLFVDDSYRKRCVSQLENSQVRYFWEKEYEKWSYPFRQTAIAPIQNKVGAFLTDPNIKRVLVDPQIDLSFREIMDGQKILLVNLAKGQIGEDASNLLGGLLVTTIGLAAFSRADIPESQRAPFHLYMDEFQNFTTLSLVNMASELRKFKCGMVLANQFLRQIDPKIMDAVLGNCGTLISFRVGAVDGVHLAKELAPTFAPEDLLHLSNYRIYLKLMIDGQPSRPFCAETLPVQKNVFISSRV